MTPSSGGVCCMAAISRPTTTDQATMHSITTLQNDKRQLQHLAAQRQLYASAKVTLGWQLLLGGPVATAVALLGIAIPATKAFVALWGISVLVLDAVWLTPRQKRLREAGARIQEHFDCDVLGLPWNSYRAVSPEPAEMVLEQATRYRTWERKMTPLTDWYPRAVNRIPLPLARLVCQRTNCWWDAKQRRAYAGAMAGMLLAAFIGVLWLGLGAQLLLPDLVLVVILPMSSAVKLGYQQWVEHREAADRLDRLRERGECSWKDALKDHYASTVAQDSRALQDEIFDGRKRNPLVFDFVFKRLRADHETQMNFGAEELVLEAERALAAKAGRTVPS